MKHAKLPASAAERWTACPASAYMKESGDRRGSTYAAEGTAAHHLTETCLREGTSPKDYIGHVIYVDKHGTALFSVEDNDSSSWAFEVNPDMVEAAELFIQCTVDSVMTLGLPLQKGESAKVYIEERVTPGHPSLGGTLDWAYVAGDFAVIMDLKYGRGIVVDVEDNPQQMIYALGLMARHPNIKAVYSYIVQPRAPHVEGPVRWTEYTAEELASFYKWLLERVKDTNAPGAPRVAGDHCRFCPDLGNCPEAFKVSQDAAAVEFDEDTLAATIAGALSIAPMVEAWVKAVRAEALNRLMDDKLIPGWKLVHGRGMRQWMIDDDDVVKLARKAGLLKAACYAVPKLLSPHGMEQAAAKGKLTGPQSRNYFSDYWEKVLGGPAVAPDDDPRELFRVDPSDDFAVK